MFFAPLLAFPSPDPGLGLDPGISHFWDGCSPPTHTHTPCWGVSLLGSSHFPSQPPLPPGPQNLYPLQGWAGGWTSVGWAVAGSCGPRWPGWEPDWGLGQVHLASQSQAELLFIAPGTWLVYFKLLRSQRRAHSKLGGAPPSPLRIPFPMQCLASSQPRDPGTLPGPHPGPAWHEPASSQTLSLLVGSPLSPHLAEQKTRASTG